MIRSLARHVGRFVLAVVLLVVLLCTVEVVMRVRRVRQRLQDETVSTDAELIRPSRTTFLEPVPLLDTVGGDAESVTIVTSEWGTRGKSPVLPKPVNTFRILCLGGEETFARTLPEEETFAQLATFLQQQTGRPVEVINAGCPTSSPLSQTLRLRQRLLQLQPDLVVFNLQSREVSFDPIVRGSLHLDEDGHAAYAANPIYTASTNPLLASLKEEFATVDWVLGKTQNTLQDLSRKATPLSEEELGLSIDVLQEAQQLTNAQRAHCFVSLVPDTWETVPPAGVSAEQRATPLSIYSSLTAANGQQRIVFLDTVSNFRHHTQPRELFTANGKLSPAGHRLYAATLGQAILQQVSAGSNRPVPQYSEAPPVVRESEMVRRPTGP